MRLQWLAAGVAAAAVVLGARAQSAEPGAYELEMWRSATRLDVKEAYDGYLARFPQGAFADMARLSLQRLGAPAAAAPAAPKLPADIDTTRLAQADASRALEVQPGDRLLGPGVVSVGWFGAKRQLVVPKGEWLVLDTFDHDLRGFVTVQMSTVVLAQLQRNALRSVIVASFNSRTVPNPAGGAANPALTSQVPLWPAAGGCDSAGDAALHKAVETSRRLRVCSSVRRTLAAERWPNELEPVVREHLAAALARIGTTAPPMALRTDVQMTEPSQAHLGYLRFDADADADTAPRIAWVRGFTPLATQGYWRKFDGDDLVAGAARPASDSPFAQLPD
jgi:hypothetical protein